MPAKPQPHQGDLLNDRYQLITPLASGGMSIVWRALDRRLGRHVAVKLLPERLCDDAHARARLHVEAQALARLHHPHIAALHDFGTIDTGDGPAQPFLVMELVDGPPLTAVAGRLSWQASVRIAADVAAALAEAHRHGIVHRDITAANVLLSSQGAKVIDFGICAVAGDNETAGDRRLLGTPAYLAPERLGDSKVGPAVDTYALGVLLYLLLTRQTPWPPPQSKQDLAMIRHRRPPNPLDIMGLPAEVADACLRCLDTDPLRRPTAAALAATLHTAAPAAPAESLTQLPGVAPTVATPITFTGPTEVKALRRQHRTRHRSHGRTAALAAGVAACGLLTWLLAGWTPTAPIDQPQALGPAAPAPTGIDCQVLYRVSAGGGTAYTADLTVTNLGPRQIGPDWQLRLTMPDAQPMHLPADGKWHQDGATVIFHSVDGALPTGRSRQMTVTGAGAAPLPDTFRLNENACAATVTLASPTGSGAAAPTVPETVGRNTEDDGKPERKPAPKPKPPNNAAASKAR